MQPRWPALRLGETRKRLAQSRSRRATAIEDLGEPIDLGICQINMPHAADWKLDLGVGPEELALLAFREIVLDRKSVV